VSCSGIGTPFTPSLSPSRTYKISRGNRRILYSLAGLFGLVVPVGALPIQIPDKYPTRFTDAMVHELLRSPQYVISPRYSSMSERVSTMCALPQCLDEM